MLSQREKTAVSAAIEARENLLAAKAARQAAEEAVLAAKEALQLNRPTSIDLTQAQKNFREILIKLEAARAAAMSAEEELTIVRTEKLKEFEEKERVARVTAEVKTIVNNVISTVVTAVEWKKLNSKNTITHQQLNEAVSHYSTTGRIAKLFSCFVSPDRGTVITGLRTLLEKNQATYTKEDVVLAISRDTRRLSLFQGQFGIEKNGTSTDDVLVELRNKFK